tara:strand:- start:198 stop:413 length:216 start_codon:yes stop_codon:yes gene_type:complete
VFKNVESKKNKNKGSHTRAKHLIDRIASKIDNDYDSDFQYGNKLDLTDNTKNSSLPSAEAFAAYQMGFNAA